MARLNDIKTPLCRFSYTQDLFKARAQSENGTPKYGCTLLFPKSTDLTALKEAAVKVAVEEWGEKAKQMLKDELIKSPFLDGDGKQGINKKTGERHQGYAGTVFLRVGSGADYKPKIVDRKVNLITSAEEFYSGCWGYAVLSVYTWENKEQGKGISFGISMAQKVKDDDKLGGGGGGDPEKVFEAISDDAEAPAEAKGGKGAAGLFG